MSRRERPPVPSRFLLTTTAPASRPTRSIMSSTRSSGFESSRSCDTGGIGLGLPILRAIFRAHDGDAQPSYRTEGGLRATAPSLAAIRDRHLHLIANARILNSLKNKGDKRAPDPTVCRACHNAGAVCPNRCCDAAGSHWSEATLNRDRGGASNAKIGSVRLRKRLSIMLPSDHQRRSRCLLGSSYRPSGY